MQLRPDLIRQQISNLRLAFGDLEADEETWLLALESETELPELLRHIERRRQEATHMAGGIEEWMIELQTRQKRLEQREQSLRATAFKLMEAADVRKIEMAEASYSIASGKPRVLITNEAALPLEAFRIKREPDKTKIKAALEEGQEVPGACLSNSEPHLTIRTR